MLPERRLFFFFVRKGTKVNGKGKDKGKKNEEKTLETSIVYIENGCEEEKENTGKFDEIIIT